MSLNRIWMIESNVRHFLETEHKQMGRASIALRHAGRHKSSVTKRMLAVPKTVLRVVGTTLFSLKRRNNVLYGVQTLARALLESFDCMQQQSRIESLECRSHTVIP